MKRLLSGAIAALILLSSVGPVTAADVKPLGNVGGSVRPFHTGETVPILNGGTGATTAAAARTALGVAIGTNVQAYDADLTTWGSITPSANVQTLLASINFAGFRTSLDVYSKGEVDTAVAAAGVLITYKDEGSNLTTATTSIDCVGAGITCTNSTGAVTVTVSGAAAGTVTASGGSTGALAKFSSSSAITAGDLTGDVTTSGGVATTIASNAVTTAKILNANVTLAKIANASANSKLLGSGAAGSGAAYAEITLGTNLSVSGTTLNAVATPGTGGGLFSSQLTTIPTVSSTGLSNFLGTGAASADTAAGVLVSGTSGGMGAYTTSVPGTPYTITALVAASAAASAVPGLGWTDGTKVQFIYASTAFGILVQNNSNITTFAAGPATLATAIGNFKLVWLRINDNGTNVTFSYSNDGVNFSSAYTIAKASGYLGSSGYTHIFVGAPGGSGTQNNTVMAWTQN